MSRTASQWFPNVAAPDLSNVLSMAGRTGANQGYNEFMAELIKERNEAAEARKEQREEKKAAEEDLAEEPESEGFWQKLGQTAGDGLMKTIDVLSRFNYASANVFKEFSDDDGGGEEKNFFKKIGEEVGESADAWWQGFSGKEKTTFAQVIAQNAAKDGKDNYKDNKWVQGIGGFAADVLLDPTTYIGLGLVTKPFRAGSKAAGTQINDHARNLWDFAGDAEKLGIRVGRNTDEAGNPIYLTRRNIYDALGGPTIKQKGHLGRAYKEQSSRVRNARNYVNNYQVIRQAIKDAGHEVNDESINSMTKQLDDLKVARDNALAQYGQNAYRQALKTYDPSKSKISPAPVGPEIAEKATRRFEQAVDTVTVAKVISRVNMAMKNVPKPPKSGASRAAIKAYDDQQAEVFQREMGEAFLNDPRITPEFRANVWSEVKRLSKTDPKVQALRGKLYGDAGIYARIRKLEDALEDNPSDRALRSQLIKEKGDRDAGIKGALAYAWEQHNMAQANIFIRLLGHHVGDARFQTELGQEFGELGAREAEIMDRLKNLDVGDVSSAPRTSHDAPGMLDETAGLKRELAEIQKRKAELLGDDAFMQQADELVTPEGAPNVQDLFVTNPDGTLSLTVPPGASNEVREWAVAVSQAVDVRSTLYVNQKISTWRRTKRAERAAKRTAVLEKAFGGPKGNSPRITIDGEELVLGPGKAFRDKMEKYVTDADRKAYRAEATGAANKTVDQGDATVKLDGSEATVGQAAAKADVTKTGFAAKSQEWHAFNRMFQEQHGISMAAAIKARKTGDADIAMPIDYNPKVPADLKKQWLAEGNSKAIKSVQNDLADGRLTRVTNNSVDLQGEILEHADQTIQPPKDAHKTVIKDTKEEYARRIAEAKMAAPRGNSKPALLNAQIKELEAARDAEIALYTKAAAEADNTSAAMLKRMDEQVTLNMLEDAIKTGRNYLRVNFAGAKLFDLPTPVAMTKATEKIGGLPVLQAAHKAWSQAFHPASTLEPELNLARLRAQARTPDIIKHHVDDIRDKFVKYKPAERKIAFESVRKGVPVGDPALYDEMEQFFKDFLPYVQGKVKIDDQPLEILELNRYLPENFQLVHPKKGNVNLLKIKTPQDLLRYMRNTDNADPMQVMWRLKIASEQALANKGMKNTIRNVFGVKRVIEPSAKFAALNENEKVVRELVEDLHDKHGWVSVRSMGDDYYFPPELAEQINRLDEIIQPAKIHEVTRLFDKVLRAWKATVTVYNPGYYTRNGIGETIMGAMDGVWNAAHYKRSGYILSHTMPDDVQQALKTLEPWKRHETSRQAMARKVTKRSFVVNGKRQQLTNEDVWILYHEVGLKSGFISTEFDHYFPTAGTMKASPVGQIATKINDSVRHGGEKYEDYFRLAHFISRLERSKIKDARAAAEDAARYVRKFHYDYTDFTPFEKTVMMRIFPFYKWTRKSLPLMGSLLFTRPGLVSLYPKGMQNLSYATGGTDPLNDENGFAPNYEELTPNWIENLMGYPLGEDEESAMTYMNIATPQFDIYKMMQNPVSASIGMMNPMFKVPLEQAMGQTMDPDFNMKLETGESRLQHLMRTTPAGSLTANVLRGEQEGEDSAITEPGNSPLDERLTSFLTGLGFYENNEKRQQGEQLRRNLEGK